MASTTLKHDDKFCWLLQAKKEITKTAEWEEFTSELLDVIEQQLSESHVKSFSDLMESEKALFLERAAKLLQENSSHKRLLSKVSELLERNLNENIKAELLNPLNRKTKTDLILGQSCDASIEILRTWPDLRNKLFHCLNQPLRGYLRKEIWSFYLLNSKNRNHYREKANSISSDSSESQDTAIVQKCQVLLCSEPSFKDLCQSSAIAFAMGKILSYRQRLKTPSTLVDTDYLLLVPFMKVFTGGEDSLQLDGGLETNELLAQILETYLMFLDCRPLFSRDTGTKESCAALKTFGVQIAEAIQLKDYQLASHLKKIYLNDKSCSLSEGLAALLRSYVRCLFVGFLALDTVCFIWDQIILNTNGNKLPVTQAFCVTLLILLKEKLLKCLNVRNVQDVILEGAKQLTVGDFQNEVEDKYIPEWMSVLNYDQHSYTLPLVDPLASEENRNLWSSWFAKQGPPQITRPEDRRAARQARENDRRMQLERKLKEERDRRKELELAQKEKEKQMEKQENEEERLRLLKDQLEAERFAHQQAKAQMTEEIARLKLQLEARSLSVHLSSPQVTSMPRASSTLTEHSTKSQTAEEEANDVARLLVGRVVGSIDLLTHGKENNKHDLNLSTKTSLERRSSEYYKVMHQLFGKKLAKDDWDRMSEEDRQRKTDLLLRAFKEQLHRP